MPGTEAADEQGRPTVTFKKIRENPDAEMADEDYKVVDINHD